MNKIMKEVWNLVRIEARRWLINVRFYLTLFLTFCALYLNQGGIPDYLKAKGIRVTAFELYAFTLSDPFFYLVLVLLYTFLICDIPFLHDGVEMELIRTDRKKWILSKMIITGFITILWLIFIELSILVIQSGFIEWKNEWSAFLKTAARASGGGSMGINISLSIDTMLSASPVKVFLLGFAYNILFYNFLAVLMLYFNILSGKHIGIIAAVFVVGFRFFNRVIWPSDFMKLISPADLMNISGREINAVNIIYTVSFFLFCSGMIISLILKHVERKEIFDRI